MSGETGTSVNPTQKKSPTIEFTHEQLLEMISNIGAANTAKDDRLTEVLSALLEKENRIIQKEKLLEQQSQARDEERKRESERYTIAIIETQKACRHLKGGNGRTKSQQRDPAVYGHTFTDGKIQIKCTLCKAKWLPKDTAEYLDRNGSKIPNWTGIGWREALAMAEDSSNRPSSSERFFAGTHEQKVTDDARAVAKMPNIQF